jgi:hypothetical protein
MEHDERRLEMARECRRIVERDARAGEEISRKQNSVDFRLWKHNATFLDSALGL